MIVFLRSDSEEVKPSDNKLPVHKPSFLERALMKLAFKPIPYQENPLKRPVSSDSAAYGKYLVDAVYACYMCHSADLEKVNVLEPEKTPNYLKGGYEFHMEAHQIKVPNIAKGAKSSTWSVEQFVKALREDERPGIAKKGFLEPMHTYPLIDSLEATGIYYYLQSMSK